MYSDRATATLLLLSLSRYLVGFQPFASLVVPSMTFPRSRLVRPKLDLI